jgi:peptidoglycan/xylan/chitin deacetylase (PgdA/CDA1 family)
MLRAIRARRSEVVVLNLHRVCPISSPFWPALPPEDFEALVSHLSRTCQVLTLEQLPEVQPSSRVRVVLSFDDGFRDFVEYAMPVLDRYGIRVNQNVIVESVRSERPPWIVAVMDALAAAPLGRIQTLSVPGFDHRLESEDEQAKLRYGTLLANFLKAKPPAERATISHDVNALLEETDSDTLTPMMSLADTRSVATVHELGSHSYSHESMAPMTEPEFEGDFDRCETFFSSIGLPLRIFAFPNGSYRPDQVQVLLSRGVRHVLLVEERASRSVQGVHPRITIYGDSPAELRLRSAGWHPPRMAWING